MSTSNKVGAAFSNGLPQYVIDSKQPKTSEELLFLCMDLSSVDGYINAIPLITGRGQSRLIPPSVLGASRNPRKLILSMHGFRFSNDKIQHKLKLDWVAKMTRLQRNIMKGNVEYLIQLRQDLLDGNVQWESVAHDPTDELPGDRHSLRNGEQYNDAQDMWIRGFVEMQNALKDKSPQPAMNSPVATQFRTPVPAVTPEEEDELSGEIDDGSYIGTMFNNNVFKAPTVNEYPHKAKHVKPVHEEDEDSGETDYDSSLGMDSRVSTQSTTSVDENSRPKAESVASEEDDEVSEETGDGSYDRMNSSIFTQSPPTPTVNENSQPNVETGTPPEKEDNDSQEINAGNYVGKKSGVQKQKKKARKHASKSRSNLPEHERGYFASTLSQQVDAMSNKMVEQAHLAVAKAADTIFLPSRSDDQPRRVIMSVEVSELCERKPEKGRTSKNDQDQFLLRKKPLVTICGAKDRNEVVWVLQHLVNVVKHDVPKTVDCVELFQCCVSPTASPRNEKQTN